MFDANETREKIYLETINLFIDSRSEWEDWKMLMEEDTDSMDLQTTGFLTLFLALILCFSNGNYSDNCEFSS